MPPVMALEMVLVEAVMLEGVERTEIMEELGVRKGDLPPPPPTPTDRDSVAPVITVGMELGCHKWILIGGMGKIISCGTT